MSNVNVAVLQGNLVADPEVVGNEKNVARFTVAVNNGYGDNKETTFMDCVAFGKQVDVISQHLKKGKQIIVTGSLRQNRWKDAEGNNRSKIELVLNNFNGFAFVGGGGGQKEEAPIEVSAAATATAGKGEGKLF